jgi:ADP-ribose pyrophosphatase YjhB (NUDIX family)
MVYSWKEGVASLVRRQPFSGMMAWGVRAAVPRQRVGVALVAFNDNEDVFLLKHVFHTANPWGLPGGWLARDEAPARGVARELREETGLSAVIGPAVCVAHKPAPVAHIALAYLGWIAPGPLTLNAEVLEGRWFAADALPRPLASFTLQAIDAARPLFRQLPVPHAEAWHE